jgi:hypothetical protein
MNIESGNGIGHSSEALTANLRQADEASLREMLAVLSERMRHLATRSEVREVAGRVAVVEERMSHMATKAWVLSGFAAVLVAVLGGFWWIVQQYLSPLLRAAS